MLRSPSLEPVSLNVGGTLYTTQGETLSRYPDSMLGAMFRGQLASARDQSGHLFIDRDGKPFRHILNYLRSSHLDLPEGYREMRLLRREADFYQIRPLLDELAARRQGQEQALLQCNVQSRRQTLHFNLRRGPHHYALSACPLTAHRAHIFCTCPAFLGLLRSALGCPPAPETPAEGEEGGEGEGEAASDGTPSACRLELLWTPRPPELPEAEYAKHGFRRLRARPGGRELVDGPAFVEELLKLALAQRFRLDSVLPDPSDVLNCTALRLVRY
uniref:BTB/POZ domain-containing protein KCTD11-like n=1 Tax=Pristiophorus japonicus TaxID=55135 RepID=UPI00398EBEAB